MPSFILNALIAGVGLAMIMGPIGCFVIWRRIAFVGDTMAHSAIAGVALALIYEYDSFWGVLLTSVLVSVLLANLKAQRWLPMDTWLAILAHSLLAVGVVIFAMAQGGLVDLQAYLFGDILTLSGSDIRVLYTGIFILGGILIWIWRPLLALTINQDLAAAERIPVRLYDLVFMLIIALLVSLSVRLVGVLLLTALLIIPASTARIFSKNPYEMVALSMLLGAANVILGVFGSYTWDAPTSPFIVVCALILFIVMQSTRLIRDWWLARAA